jgi:ComF family protein
MHHVSQMLIQAGACLTHALRDALFPPACLQCGAFFHPPQLEAEFPESISFEAVSALRNVEKIFQNLMRPYLCPTCLRGFTAADSPLCLQCGLIFKSREGEDRLCESCIRNRKHFRIARAAGVYDRAMMAVVHELKYGGTVQLAAPLSVLLLCVFLKYWRRDAIDLVVPVPLYSRRFRRRGFNQSYLIVRPWMDLLRGLNGTGFTLDILAHGLKRTRPTLPQTGLGRRDRLSNVHSAFEISSPNRLKNKRILIVDDVYTTGATVNECARVLLQGGASVVDVLTLARAM